MLIIQKELGKIKLVFEKIILVGRYSIHTILLVKWLLHLPYKSAHQEVITQVNYQLLTQLKVLREAQ